MRHGVISAMRAVLVMIMGVGVAHAQQGSVTGASAISAQAQAELPQPAAFGSCISCHSVVTDAVTFGPNLRGVMGRRAGSLDGYAYSDAMKAADFTWDAAKLDAWITNPKHVLMGTKMPFPGIRFPERRQEIIAYLSSLK